MTAQLPTFTDDQLVALEDALTEHPECVWPGAPRSVSRDYVIPVDAVLRVLRGDGERPARGEPTP